MRRQLLGFSLIIVLAALPLLPSLMGMNPVTPAVVIALPPIPGPNDLNATTPEIIYEEYTPANPSGNSSLISIIVSSVTASDIGECRTGDLLNHTFHIQFAANTTEVWQDDLQYVSGVGWAALNYSLLPVFLGGEKNYTAYRINCFFARDSGIEIWNTTTDYSASFFYSHRLTIGKPDFTYIADTSDTIDIVIGHISSTIWGQLTQANHTLAIVQKSNTSNVLQFTNLLVYNASSTDWEYNELNISALIPGEIYTIRVSGNYSLRYPFHSGTSSISDEFTFRGPFLRVSNPIILYIGRDIQTLNITVLTVWHSVFGYLTDADISIANFSIYLASGGVALVTNILTYNSTGGNWYLADFNVSEYIEQGSLLIGEYYNVSTFFHAPSQSGRVAVNATSPFSEPFLIDRDPPKVETAFTTPSSPDDDDFVIITGTVSDDALVHTVICSYYNGTQWINVTMRGHRAKLADFTTTLPAFPERSIIQYRIFVNDTQSAWTNSSLFSYTVVDTPPIIAYVSYLPNTPRDTDQVVVNATITDGTGVNRVQLSYSFDGITWITIDMQLISDSVYQATIPAHGLLPSYQFDSVLFRVEAFDVYDNMRQSADYAYIVRGTMLSIDPITGLLLLSAFALAVVVIIVLLKIYEQF
ncbi:MAG: hypothetical protein ACFE89_03630 [Candidatus Hodarchaeota archaeon]